VEVVASSGNEEMAFIAAAAAGARLLSSAARRAAAPLTNASYSTAGPSASDIEDSPLPRRSRLAQFRERRALAVTDITATEWCEKKMEFELKHGKPERTEAMKAGSDRHAQLEHEVFQRVDIAHSHRSSRNNGSRNEERGTRNDAWDGILHCGNENVLYSHQNGVPGTWNAPSFHDPGDYDITIRSVEESWAVKFVSFIEGTNRLMLEDELKDVAREIPVFGVIEGTWIIGIIDEIRMHMDGISVQPILIDTKTRAKPTIPSEPQKRNGRLQLMCYKYLWDSLIAKKFPAENFFSYFDLDPNYLLSDDIKGYTNSLGVNAKVLTLYSFSKSSQAIYW